MKPAISVIIPAYNEEKYLAAALSSTLAQTYNHQAIEVIIVNNASTDRTVDVYKEFVRQNKTRVKMILVEEEVLGVSRAKNKGASIAQGDILLFLDADSQMSPNLAEVIIGYYRRGYLMGIIRLIPDSLDWWPQQFFRLIEFGKRTFRIAAQMGYCDRSLFWRGGGFNPALRLSEDLEFFTRLKKILKKEKKDFAYIHEAWIRTSTRRMDSFPLNSGYIFIFFQWFLSFLGLGRQIYKPYR